MVEQADKIILAITVLTSLSVIGWFTKTAAAIQLAAGSVGVLRAAFLAIGLQASTFSFPLKWIYFFLFVGTILFSVSIYFLAIQEILGVSLPFLGPVTPLGGGLLIAGWIIFLVQILRSNN